MSRHWRGTSRAGDGLQSLAANACSARRKECADHYLAGKWNTLPFTTPTFDLAWSNLAVQWWGDFSTGTPRAVWRVIHPEAWWRLPRWCRDGYPNCVRQVAVDERPHANHFLPQVK
ncbi:hypothetical protein ACNKHL_04315 [Shigella flexneri]